MTQKHTPGPWTILNEATGSVGADAPYKMTAIAYGDHEECKPDERMLANARLIAAAPDLLEACIEALENDEASEGFNASNMDESLRSKLRAAIAKATGE